ncbi:MAG: Ig-like domain-containing protein [Candidatus Berkelbacteria bacterium]|nr:Ig-like domain-containing protein [Candidatus Berkelbacteria bacterium]
MKRITAIITSALLVAATVFCLNISPANAAATATISASPGSGAKTTGVSFNVTISVNGGGQNFTSFGASVATTNLTIVSLTKGSSVEKWTTEPSTGSLNFFGAVSGSKGSVTAYTLKVKGKKAGKAYISISGGSVKSTDGYSVTDIFSSSSGGSYTIADAPAAPAATTPAVVAPASPVLPDTEADLANSWGQYSVDPILMVSVGTDTTAALDSTGNLTGVKFSGSATPGALISAYIFSSKLVKSATADANGLWSIVLTEGLADGSHTAYFVSTKDGVNTRISKKLAFTVDATNKTATEVASTAATETSAATNVSHWYSNPWLWTGVGLILIVLILVWYFYWKKHRKSAQ